MLINLSSFVYKRKRLDGLHHGIVVDNIDPKGLGHIKVKVDNVIDGDNDVLPWVAPKFPTFLGGASNVSYFSIPNIGSNVIVEFFDIYNIYYTGVVNNEKHIVGEDIASNFNNKTAISKYGIIDDEGTIIEVDRANNTFHIHHKSTEIHLRDNAVSVVTPHNTNVTSSKTITVTGSSRVKLVSGGSSVDVTPSNITLHSQSIDMTN